MVSVEIKYTSMSKEKSDRKTYKATEEERAQMRAFAKERGIDLDLRGNEDVKKLRNRLEKEREERKHREQEADEQTVG